MQLLITIVTLFSARKREYVFTGVGLCVCVCVCLSVCLSVTTITKKIVDGFVPNFMGRFVGEREDHLRVSVRSVEGCGSNVYIYTSNSGDKTPQNFAFAGSCTLSEYFPFSYYRQLMGSDR